MKYKVKMLRCGVNYSITREVHEPLRLSPRGARGNRNAMRDANRAEEHISDLTCQNCDMFDVRRGGCCDLDACFGVS